MRRQRSAARPDLISGRTSPQKAYGPGPQRRRHLLGTADASEEATQFLTTKEAHDDGGGDAPKPPVKPARLDRIRKEMPQDDEG